MFPVGFLGALRHTVLTSPLPFAPPLSLVLRHPRERRLAQRHRPGFYFMLLSALVGKAAYESAAMAYARAASFRQSYTSVAEAMLAGTIVMEAARFRFGAQALTSLVTGPHPSQCAPASIPALTASSLLAEADLRSVLLSYTTPDSAAQQYIHDWGNTIHSFDPSDIPPEACSALPTLQQEALLDVPFSFPTPIVATIWKDRKPPQSCQSCPGVSHCSQLIIQSPSCSGLLQEWWGNATADFVRLATDSVLELRLTRTIALGQDCLLPCARDCIWDCRVPGQVRPLDYHQEVDAHASIRLNRQLLVDSMHSWPDQELRSHMHYGVRFGADLPLQLVLTPQLKSLATAFERTQRELRELVDRGWYALFDYLPFVPLRMHPKGATERKLENRPRPTTDGSHPHASQHVFDTDGSPVTSLNSAIKTGAYLLSVASPSLHAAVDSAIASAVPLLEVISPIGFQPGMPSWWEAYATWKHASDAVPKEYKPTISAVARDSAILAYPARCQGTGSHQPIYVFVDDFRNYFSQLPVAAEDLWKSVVAGLSTPHLADHLTPPTLQFVAEYRLGFGITTNSNVAQRLSTFILHLFLEEFRQQEKAYLDSEPQCVQAWVRRRQALARLTGRREDTLFRAHIYTDDPIFLVIGAQRTRRALTLWRSITLRFNLLTNGYS